MKTTLKMSTSALEAYLDAQILAGNAIIMVYFLPYDSDQQVYVTTEAPAIP